MLECWRPVGTSVVPASSSHQTKLKFKRSLTQASVAGGREAGGRRERRRRREEAEGGEEGGGGEEEEEGGGVFWLRG